MTPHPECVVPGGTLRDLRQLGFTADEEGLQTPELTTSSDNTLQVLIGGLLLLLLEITLSSSGLTGANVNLL